MTFKVSNNQYSRPYSSDSWASCLIGARCCRFPNSNDVTQVDATERVFCVDGRIDCWAYKLKYSLMCNF